MSQWTEEVLASIHNIGLEDSSDLSDYAVELEDFSAEELRVLQTKLSLLKLAVRRQQSKNRRSLQ